MSEQASPGRDVEFRSPVRTLARSRALSELARRHADEYAELVALAKDELRAGCRAAGRRYGVAGVTAMSQSLTEPASDAHPRSSPP